MKKSRWLSILVAIVIIISALGSDKINVNAASEGWVNSGGGWWYRFSDGSYAKSEYIDGYWLNSAGWYEAQWTGGWKKNATGWWFESGSWYPESSWLKVNKKWYHFDGRGYMDENKWVDGYYVGSDGAWIPDYKGDSGSSSSGGKVIVIDPGHSGNVASGTEPIGPGSSEYKAKDAGGTKGVSTGIPEYQLTMTIANKLKTELESRGYTVKLTRYDNNTAISCKERAEVANNANAAAYIRLHADGATSSSARGASTICITSGNPYISSMYSQSKSLSQTVLNEYTASTGLKNRGVSERDDLSGNNWSKVPTTLIEMGFMTNSTEDALLNDSSFQNKMVTGIANGIDKFLK